jgi:hypothetical protein
VKYNSKNAALAFDDTIDIFVFSLLNLHQRGGKTYVFILANWVFVHGIPRAGW